MPRTKGYQLEKVFANALLFVRKNGYRGCDMERLIEVTHFNRRAFYIEFGKKETFFVELTKFYINTSLATLSKNLYQSKNMHDNFTAFFNAYDELLEQGPCLLVRLLSEIGSNNEAINLLAKNYYDQLTQHIIAALEKANPLFSPNEPDQIEQLALQMMFLTQSYALCYNLPQGKQDIHLLLKSLIDKS